MPLHLSKTSMVDPSERLSLPYKELLIAAGYTLLGLSLIAHAANLPDKKTQRRQGAATDVKHQLKSDEPSSHAFTIKREWTPCQKDDDCTAIVFKGTCQWNCINKQFQEEANAYHRESYFSSTFLCQDPDPWTMPATACRNNVCTCQGIMPLRQ